MKKIKIKSESERALWIKMSNKIYMGWKVIKPPYQNWLGKWICKLEKPEKV